MVDDRQTDRQTDRHGEGVKQTLGICTYKWLDMLCVHVYMCVCLCVHVCVSVCTRVCVCVSAVSMHPLGLLLHDWSEQLNALVDKPL